MKGILSDLYFLVEVLQNRILFLNPPFVCGYANTTHGQRDMMSKHLLSTHGAERRSSFCAKL